MKLGYIVGSWPSLSETFVANEITFLLDADETIYIFSIERPPQATVQILNENLTARTEYRPALWSPRIAWAHIRLFIQHPVRYVRTLLHALLSSEKRAKQLFRTIHAFWLAGIISEWVNKNGLDHLHAHFAGRRTAMAMMVHWFTNISYSFTVHAGIVYREAASLPERVKNARFVAAISNHIRTYLLDICGDKYGEKVHLLRNGIPLHLFKSNVREPREPFFILAIGRLVEEKGFHYLISACRELRSRGIDFRCDIAGDGPLYKYLDTEIRANSLQSIMHLLGPLPHGTILTLLREAGVLVSPSIVTPELRSDGIPAVLQEAMASRIPVISTRVGGIPEVVIHQETGLLIDQRDHLALADAIQRIKDHPDLARRLANAGYHHARQGWDMKKNAQKLRRLFHAAVA